jgi:hypothetical protein
VVYAAAATAVLGRPARRVSTNITAPTAAAPNSMPTTTPNARPVASSNAVPEDQ